MVLCTGALVLQKQQAASEKGAPVALNPTVTVLQQEVAAVKSIPRPAAKPDEVDPLAPVPSTAPKYKPSAAHNPVEKFDPAKMVQ